MTENQEKIKNAVVHLECATDSVRFYGLWEKLNADEISREEFEKQLSEGTRDIRYHGTAVFLKNNERRYLVTARHVLWDEDNAKTKYQEGPYKDLRKSEQLPDFVLEHMEQMVNDTIFGIIFRVPSLNEIFQDTFVIDKSFLMNLGAGTSFMVPYTFSKPELDLAIVSLDKRDSKFADNLISLGHVPVTMDDFGEEPSKEGAEVFSVGFPSSTALLGQIRQHPDLIRWSSNCFSLPTLTFGRISMLHDLMPFFWVDMSIYPGNSGGPIVEGDKIVGIVSAQSTIPVEESDNLRTRIPFGKIIKAKFIAELLSIQERKDMHSL